MREGYDTQYMREIRGVAPLTRQQEAALAARIRRGDQAALNVLVRANLRFVVSVARKYANRGMPLEDLIQEGNIGLLAAARRYDERRNTRFISYAVWWIRHYILTAMPDYSRCVSVPHDMAGEIRNVGRARDAIEQAHRRPSDAREIAAAAHMRPERAERAIAFEARVGVSTCASIPDTDRLTVEDTLESADPLPDDVAAESDRRRVVRRILRLLPWKEREIVARRYGLDTGYEATLVGAGKYLGVTREWARRIHDRAIRHLAERMPKDILE